ncbi:MAG: hypothetical protein LBO71_05010 [Prevotellaceae bacterium]|jgi:hypothetical protein|nr:hypothetical protein [Prevotellaceae bacterium]
MDTHLKATLTTMLVGLIVERNGLSEQEAIRAFYTSKIARKLSDERALLHLAPYFLYELWSDERTLGDYRKSPYATALL